MKYILQVIFSVVLCLFFNNYQLLSMEEPEVQLPKKLKISDPLVSAIENNDKEAIKAAILEGADPNRTLIAHNPLVWALKNQDQELIIFLLAHGADSSIMLYASGLILYPGGQSFNQIINSEPSITNKNFFHNLLNQPSLQLLGAIKYNYLKYAEKLLSDNPQLMQVTLPGGKSPLHLAATPQVVQLLMDWGADINAQDSYGLTPLISRLVQLHDKEKIPTLKKLLSFGPDLQYNFHRNELNPRTLLMELVSYPISALHFAHDPEIVSLLLQHGADINFKNSNGETPLMNLLKKHNFPDKLEILKIILNANPDINMQNPHGDTALHIAAKNFNHFDIDTSLEILKLLKNAGADDNIPNALGLTANQIITHILEDIYKTKFEVME